jgi:spore coat polysaccharide biosynthesis predicted glycosyltransferase SpsG
MVSNGAIYAPKLEYDVPPDTHLLLGSTYAILRKEFSQRIEREIEGAVAQVLITVGGSDSTGLTQQLIEWMLRQWENITLSVVVGPFFKDREAILHTAARKPDLVRVHSNPSDMRKLMLAADLAITGGGQTTYELAATGTPAVAIATADHQLPNLLALAEAGSILYAGSIDAADLRMKVIATTGQLIDDVGKRRKMSQMGLALVDGLGADRLADAIVKESRKRGFSPSTV